MIFKKDKENKQTQRAHRPFPLCEDTTRRYNVESKNQGSSTNLKYPLNLDFTASVAAQNSFLWFNSNSVGVFLL